MTVHYERIPSTDPRLARHVRHDSESRRYPFDTAGLTLVSTKHTRRIPVLDQGNLGSCTGNAGIGCLGTDPFYETIVPGGVPAGAAVRLGALLYALDEAGAVQLYSDATKADDYPGQYPPDDTGSDGLTTAKVLTKAGEISGYQHTFTLQVALLVLTVTPWITGVSWYDGMFDPDPDGRVRPTGSVAGGHEFVADELDVDAQAVWFTNSWGPGWGVTRDGRPGRFYMSWDDFGVLLADQGDVTVFTPLTAPTPTPVPPADADQALATVAHPWVIEHHTAIGGNAHMASALRTWLHDKGL